MHGVPSVTEGKVYRIFNGYRELDRPDTINERAWLVHYGHILKKYVFTMLSRITVEVFYMGEFKLMELIRLRNYFDYSTTLVLSSIQVSRLSRNCMFVSAERISIDDVNIYLVGEFHHVQLPDYFNMEKATRLAITDNANDVYPITNIPRIPKPPSVSMLDERYRCYLFLDGIIEHVLEIEDVNMIKPINAGFGINASSYHSPNPNFMITVENLIHPLGTYQVQVVNHVGHVDKSASFKAIVYKPIKSDVWITPYSIK
jgi:hypothetical protein